MMDLSILFTTKNSDKHITDCLLSILNQNIKNNYEIIIIDCDSIDDTNHIINNFKERFYFTTEVSNYDYCSENSEESRIKLYNYITDNQAEALNYGISKCTGKYIMKIDANNIFSNSIINDMFNFLENNKDYDVCNSCVMTNNKIFETNKHHSNEELTHNLLLSGMPTIHYTYMFRSDLNINYDINYNNIVDYKLFLDLTQNNKRIWCLSHSEINYISDVHGINKNVLAAINLKNEYKFDIFKGLKIRKM